MSGDWYVPRPLHCPAVREHRYADGGIWMESCNLPPSHPGEHSAANVTTNWAALTGANRTYPGIVSYRTNAGPA